MKIELHKRFIKEKNKLIKSGALRAEQIKKTLDLLEKDPKNHKLRVHKIICRRDKHRFSITVINTQYRILCTVCEDINIMIYIVNHDDYDRINKNC